MAPEGTGRGTARGGRGRGTRGRGRGARGARGASNATAAAAAAAAAAPVAATSDNVTPSANDVAMSDAPPAQSTREASAPAPSASSTSAQPAPSTSNPTSRSSTPRPTTTTTATRGPGGPKFVPRAIRRSQLSREAIAAQEVAKQEDKAALDARLKRTGRGGRGGARRARGGPPASFDRVIRGGAGGFGSDIQATGGNRGGQPAGFGQLYDFGSGGGGGGGGGSGGGGAGASSGRGAIKSESGFNESTRPTGRRMNTDKIVDFELLSIHDEEETKNKDSTSVLLPKGMMREEPKEADKPEIATTAEMEAAERGEPTATIITSSSNSDDDEDLFYNDNDTEMKDDGRQWPGAKEARAVKIEGEDITEIDTLTKRRAQRKEQIKAEKAERNKKKYKNLEEQMQAEKMAFQRRLFGVDSDDDPDEEEQPGVKEPRKPQIVDGAIYLWQFPPIMPPLHKVDKTKPQGGVKDEPSDDVVMSNVPSHDASEANKPLDLTEEDGTEYDDKKKAQLPPEEEEELSGLVGKLLIRKSGKMQMDWGGMLFDVCTGIPVSHYREAVLTEEDDDKKPDGFHGTAYGMGQVMGKFNAVPHWSEVKPWVVPASKLPPWGVDAAPEGWEEDPVARDWMDKHEKKRK